MGANSKISWTDHTFNPWRGCSKVHEGCANCYAEREAHRFPSNRGIWGPNGTRVMASADMWMQPIKWNKKAAAGVCQTCDGNRYVPTQRRLDPKTEKVPDDMVPCQTYKATGKVESYRARVFCASLADVFEQWDGPIHDHNERKLWQSIRGVRAIEPDDESPGFAFERRPLTMDDLRERLFAMIDATPNLDWMLTTKRPENIRRMWRDDRAGFRSALVWHRPNLWLLTSVSMQKHYDEQWPHMEKCRDLCPVIGISAEPLLGPIDVGPRNEGAMVPDWVIVGGESGPHAKARKMELEWARSLRDQCNANAIPFHFKQHGEHMPEGINDQRDLNGVFWNEFPKGATR